MGTPGKTRLMASRSGTTAADVPQTIRRSVNGGRLSPRKSTTSFHCIWTKQQEVTWCSSRSSTALAASNRPSGTITEVAPSMR